MALTAKVFRANGTVEDLGAISPGDTSLEQMLRAGAEMEAKQPPPLRRHDPHDLYMLLAFLLGLVVMAIAGHYHLFGLLIISLPIVGIVTTAGVAYMAADFASGGASPRISAFNFQDSGTGTTAAATTDTALQTPTGGARVAGTQTTPGSTNVYKSVATISYTSSLAITEWGLFSASSSGTLWDRRVFSAINVINGDAIQFSYSLTIPAGGT